MVQLGTATVIKIGGVTIAKGKSASFEKTSDMIDVTTKDSGGDREFLPGDRSATMSFEGLFDNAISSTAGYDLLETAQNAGTLVTALFGGSTGSTYSYSAYISNISRSAPEGDAETFTCTIQCTGARTKV
jgi:hypothetical protein